MVLRLKKILQTVYAPTLQLADRSSCKFLWSFWLYSVFSLLTDSAALFYSRRNKGKFSIVVKWESMAGVLEIHVWSVYD